MVSRPLDFCKFLDFPKFQDVRGNLTVVENSIHIPFDIKRVYYLYDIPAQSERAGHAHRDLHQVFISISGSFRLNLDDGYKTRSVFLNKPYQGFYLQPWIWRTVNDFSSGAVCLVLASHLYDESDYIRDYDTFTTEVAANNKDI